MVYRVYVEKKEGLDNEARALLGEARTLLGINGLEKVRLFNRYDAEGLSADLFDYAKNTVFAEPQLDNVSAEADVEGAIVFAVEYLPGQYDQRADSAAQCIQIISQQERPIIRTAKVAGNSKEASRLSTGLMTCFLIAAISASVRVPYNAYTLAVRMMGRSCWEMIWMHWAAESARWSN